MNDTLHNIFDAAKFIKEMADLETGKDQPEPHALPAINVSFVYPPIPDRRSDYCATRDDYEEDGPMDLEDRLDELLEQK